MRDSHQQPPAPGELWLTHQPPFAVELRAASNGVSHLVLTGEFDLAAVPAVEERLPTVIEPGSCLVLDMSGLSFLDSSGIRLLVRLHAAAKRDGWTLRLVPGPAPVQRTLHVAGLEDELPFLRASDGDGARPTPRDG